MNSEKTKHGFPLWIKLAYTALVCVVVPVYWRALGLANFLWFSDIALILLVPALWRPSPLIFSMLAIGVLPMELVWVIDFLSAGHLFGVADYMFGAGDMPLYLRILSGFHLVLPAVIIWGLVRLGYDRRALVCQTTLALVVLPLTYLVTDPAAQNINWVYGPGFTQDIIPPLAYLCLHIAVILCAIYLPMHYLLKRVVPRA